MTVRAESIIQNNFGTVLLAALYFLSQYVFDTTQEDIRATEKALVEYQINQNKMLVEIAVLTSEVSALKDVVQNIVNLRYTSLDAAKDKELVSQAIGSIEDKISILSQRDRTIEVRLEKVNTRVSKLENDT